MLDDIKHRIREDYSRTVEQVVGTGRRTVAERLYSPTELEGLPAAALEVALGLGNPVAAAQLQAGEVVVDLGCGGGIDTFLAARQVGQSGMVIGVDMTPAMIELARRNAQAAGFTNVEFALGEIEDLRWLPDEFVHVILSNGVVNLSPDKEKVFAEIHRLLKPGGRTVLCDMIVNGAVPPEVLANPAAWSG